VSVTKQCIVRDILDIIIILLRVSVIYNNAVCENPSRFSVSYYVLVMYNIVHNLSLPQCIQYVIELVTKKVKRKAAQC
jgi:hypothetical protein